MIEIDDRKRMNKRSIALNSDTEEQLEKLAVKRGVPVATVIRDFVEKGLSVEGYRADIDFLSSLIRHEMNSVVNTEDISKLVERQTERVVKMQMKSGKIMAGAFFLMMNLLKTLLDVRDEQVMKELYVSAMREGVAYMKRKDYSVDVFLESYEDLVQASLRVGGDDFDDGDDYYDGDE